MIEPLEDGDKLYKENDKIALIDADSVVWAACSVCTDNIPMLPKEFYTEEEWEEILADPLYDDELGIMSNIDIEEAYRHATSKLDTIMNEVKCKDYELHFTEGRKSFRYTKVDHMYKANRLPENQAKPKSPILGIFELKQRFVTEGKGTIHYDFEADDIVVAKKNQYPDRYTLVALDKDVLWALPGRHFNYYFSDLHNIPMKWIEVDNEVAMKHHYRQTLTGDKGDNVIGLKGVGPKTADKILDKCSTPLECWDKVVEAYEDRGSTVIDAITNMRLVSMHQLVLVEDKWTVYLWKPPTS